MVPTSQKLTSCPLATTPYDSQESVSIPTDGVIPTWVDLPYEILFSIFDFAKESSTFHYQGDQNRHVNWLVGAARVCKAFTEPALAVLYHSLTVTSSAQAFRLQRFLEGLSSTHIINYKTKIKKLEMDISTLTHSNPGRGAFDPADLIAYIPQVRIIDFFDLCDLPNNRDRRKPYRLHVHDSFFDALVRNEVFLTEWRWICPAWATLEHRRICVDRIVAQTSFALRSLRVLTMVDFGDTFFGVDNCPGDTTDTPRFATMMSVLPLLEKITFRKCVVPSSSLKFLPKTLTRLTFSECDGFDSFALADLLSSHGSQLTELTLNHNRNLPLSFLVGLQSACPKLQVLSVDLTYYSNLLSVDQAEPKYHKLLRANERPTWPSTLRIIEIYYLRHWDLPAAENFFSSLVDSAASLPDLRRLVLTASIDIEWRHRSFFRDTWVERYKRVFLRKSEPPNPHLRSLKAFKLWKQTQASQDSEVGPSVPNHPMAESDDSDTPLTARGRREHLSRVQQLPTPQPSEVATSSRSLRPRKKIIDAAEDSEVAQGSPSLRDQVIEDHIQGMCDVVDIRIDNLRPRENQLHESDFLDSEKSGDEDWSEGQELVDEAQDYAW